MEAEEELEKLRSELITSMARVEDEHYRMILSLMVRMMYTHENFINSVYDKLNKIIEDEERIKAIVLNGHVKNHSEHHNWIATKLESENDLRSQNKQFIRAIWTKILIAIILILLGYHGKIFFHNYLEVINGIACIFNSYTC